MVVTELTVSLIESGKSLIQQLDKGGVNVDAAFWFFFADVEGWKLVLSLPTVSREGPKKAYREVQKAIGKLGNDAAGLCLNDVVVLKLRAPLLPLLRSALRTGPGIHGIRFTGNVVDGQLIEDAYVYRVL